MATVIATGRGGPALEPLLPTKHSAGRDALIRAKALRDAAAEVAETCSCSRTSAIAWTLRQEADALERAVAAAEDDRAARDCDAAGNGETRPEAASPASGRW